MALRNYRSLNLAQLQTTSLRNRECHLTVDMLAQMPDPNQPLQDFIRALPRIGAVEGILNSANCIIQAALAKKDIVWMIDAFMIEAGLSPLIIKLVQRGLIQSVALSGAAAVRDYELAFHGKTQEDIRTGLKDGLYGMTRETGEGMNVIINEGVRRGFSLGECLGRGILDRQPRHCGKSILATCAQKLVTATVHLSIGSEGFHSHPMADGTMLGKGSLKDLQSLSARLEGLNEGGVLVSALQGEGLQQVFYHAFAISRNLGGAIDLFSLIRVGDKSPDFSEVPGINAEFHVPGPVEVMVPLLTGVLFSLVE